MNKLNDFHLGKLRGEFITEEIANQSKWFSADTQTVAEKIYARPPKAGEVLDGMIIVYYHLDNPNPRAYRVRLDTPIKDRDGKDVRYLGSVQTKPKVYFVPGTTKQMLEDVDLDIVITEGEKKGLALLRIATKDLTQPFKFLPIALSGVWNWTETHKGEKRLCGDFNNFVWSSRKVTILFDADAVDKWQVLQAQNALADTLKGLGADVYICSMPKVEIKEGKQ